MRTLTFYAKGDQKVTARHQTTLEITKDKVKTKNGDCIVATQATLALSDLPEEMKQVLRRDDANVALWIESDGIYDIVRGRGSTRLTLESETEMVIRKSGFVCGRTLMVYSDKSASELRRDLVEKIARDGAKIKLTIEVVAPY